MFSNLHVLNENFINSFNDYTLFFFSMLAVIAGIFVIVTKNPIVSVLCLIALFLSISLYLMFLGANFIGLSYALVYVGAVSILFLFILMLINIRISEIINATSNSIALAIFIGTILLLIVVPVLPRCLDIIDENLNVRYNNINNEAHEVQYIFNYLNNEIINKVDPLELSLYKIFNLNELKNIIFSAYGDITWDKILGENSHINTLGNILYTDFAVFLLLASLVLLLSMVGAILITVKN